MMNRVNLLCALLLSNILYSEVRQPEETLQLTCNSEDNLTIMWLQIDLERNEHLAWDPSNPMESIILKKMNIEPTKISFEYRGDDLYIDRNTGNLEWLDISYPCLKISMDESENARTNQLKKIKERRMF